MIKITEVLDGVKTAAIVGHIRPDGDCISSCLALAEYIRKNYDIIVDVYLEYIPETLTFLTGADTVLTLERQKTSEEKEKSYDLFLALDCGDKERLGEAGKYMKSARKTVNIDHHISNQKFAAINHVQSQSSSTCEVLYELLEEEKINRNIAICLYTGILHDTGVFHYSNTSPRTMEIVGKLLAFGFDFSKIIDESFYQRTFIQNQILGRCLMESMLILDGRCIISFIKKSIMKFYGVTSQDLDGVIDQMRMTKGVEVAIFAYEIESNQFKVSMRVNGNNVDVGKIAVYFGGGGHIKAAGCTMNGTVHDVINNLTRHIEAQLIQKEGELHS